MLYFLPQRIKDAINLIDLNKVTEIRLRRNMPIIIKYNFQNYYLSDSGLQLNKTNSIICSESHILKIINIVCENSIYAFNERIKEGYITTINGIRIGLAGYCVFDKGNILTIKNISSLNIRIPHEIKNCSKVIFDKIYSSTLFNSLIISPPGQGKTTIIKDLALKLSEKQLNVLIVDERGEMASISAEFIDKIEYCSKEYAFNYGIRSMSPNVIIMDELSTVNDWNSTLTAVNSGVKIIATSHGDTINSIINKPYFIKNVFDRYVCLKSHGMAGQVECIYDRDYLPL